MKKNSVTCLLSFVAAIALLIFAVLFGSVEELQPLNSQPTALNLRFEDFACSAESHIVTDDASTWTSHRDDHGAKQLCSSDVIQLSQQPYLLVRYAGNPNDAQITARFIKLDSEASMRDFILKLPRAAKHGWLAANVLIPPEFREKKVKLIINDESTHPDGWLAIRALAQISNPIVSDVDYISHSARALLAVAATLLLALLLWLAPSPLLAWPFFALATALLYWQFRTFYHADEYMLLQRFAGGVTFNQLLLYNGHFEPLFLFLYSSMTRWVGAWYEPLQIGMALGHAMVAALLYSFLLRAQLVPRVALGFAILYSSAWVNVDVVPWFMELSFLGTTIFTLVAFLLLQLDGQKDNRWAKAAAAVVCVLACLTFTSGLLLPWLCLAYSLLLGNKRITLRTILLFGTIGVAGLTTALWVIHSAQAASIPHHFNFWASAQYWTEGVLRGSLATLVGLRDAPYLIPVLILGIGITIVWQRHTLQSRPLLRYVVLSSVWLGSAYFLQAVVRSDLGHDQALSFRYSYLGMLGAAALLAFVCDTVALAVRHHRYAPAMTFVAMGLLLGLVQHNHYRALKRLYGHESEYFLIDRQYYEILHAEPEPLSCNAHLPVAKTIAFEFDKTKMVTALFNFLSPPRQQHANDAYATCLVLDEWLRP